MAGSSLTLDTHESPQPSVGRLVFDAVGDDTSGLIPALVLPRFDGRILSITTNPGVAPTALYDITLDNADGFDILGGAGANLSATATERNAVTDGYVSRQEATTLNFAGTTAVDATVQVVLHYTQNV